MWQWLNQFSSALRLRIAIRTVAEIETMPSSLAFHAALWRVGSLQHEWQNHRPGHVDDMVDKGDLVSEAFEAPCGHLALR